MCCKAGNYDDIEKFVDKTLFQSPMPPELKQRMIARVREDQGRLLSVERRRHEVIIVGAGFTGLAAATELVEQGIDAIVLEARDRVGGRVESAINELGERLDTGGQFLCEDMPELMRLARQFGKTFRGNADERRLHRAAGLSKAKTLGIYEETMAIRERMDALEPDDPAIAEITVAGWLDRQNDGVEAKSAFHSLIEGLWCQAMDRIPMWHLVDNDRRCTNEVSELQYFLGETLHSLADDMARQLGAAAAARHAGDGNPAWPGRRPGHGARAVLRGRARHHCGSAGDGLAHRLRAGAARSDCRGRSARGRAETLSRSKLRYERAFWRDSGLSGTVMWRDPHGLFVCDTSDPGHPALVAFITGPLARRWSALGTEGILRELTPRLAAALGPEAGTFIASTLRDWTDDPWSGGGYSDLVLDIEAHDAEALLREGVGPLQFAASEVSPSFPGYVEGAVVAGKIAAEKRRQRCGSAAQSAIATSASGS